MYCTDRDVDNGFISLLNALVDDFGQIHGGFMDKRIDIVAARYMGGVGELLWLQQPYEKDGGWNIRKIHEVRFQIKLQTY